MSEQGKGPNDFRSEAERVRPREGQRNSNEEYTPRRRAVQKVPNNFTIASRNEDQGAAPDQPTGRREPHNHMGSIALTKHSHDETLQKEVVEQLAIDPETSTSEIGVEVIEGLIILTGNVDTINTKYQVEQNVKRVRGIKGVENRLSIRVGQASEEFTRNTEASRIREKFARDTRFK